MVIIYFSANIKPPRKNNSVELEASLAPAEAEVWAVAKADQKQRSVNLMVMWIDYGMF